MRFAPIVPMAMLEDIREAQYHMVLLQQCTVPAYATFYREVEGWKILDNGAAEGHDVDFDELKAMAFQLQVNEVVAPDVLGNMDETYSLLVQFRKVTENHRVMAVLQCRTWVQFDYIFKAALNQHISSVALPRVMTETLGPMARLVAAEMIRKESDIPIHALGSTRRLGEAKDLARQGIVRGIDTSAPVVQGLRGESLRGLYKKRPEDFFDRESTEAARRNLYNFNTWCENPKASSSSV